MRMLRFDPLDRPVSAVGLGLYPLGDMSQDLASEVLDTWLDVGGNLVDTAPVYGDGRSERALGEYLRASGRRSDVVIISKACHPAPDGRERVNPDAISQDLSASLARLGVEWIDIYMLHRDYVTVPVAPLIDRLNEEMGDGRIRSFGVSNWSTARIAEAMQYSMRRGLASITSSSAHMSLAREVVPFAPDVTPVRRRDVSYYRQADIPLFAWAALAEGWFGAAAARSTESRFESVANRERRRRVHDLAAALQLTPSQIAIAWLLCQPTAIYGIFSSMRPAHIREMAEATAVALDSEVLRWLDLETDVVPRSARRHS